MPSSAKDRFTVDYERIFFFTKNERYYFETQYEPYSPSTMKELNDKTENWTSKYDGQKEQGGVGMKGRIITGIKFGGNKAAGYGNPTYSGKEWKPNMAGSGIARQRAAGLSDTEISGGTFGRLKRCVWDITTKGFPDAHFATFPEDLVMTPIKAGCPEWVCKKCGKPRQPIWEATEEYKKLLGKGWHDHKNDAEQGQEQDKDMPAPKVQQYEIKGLSDCGCGVGFEPGVALDPFFGSGTVGLVALKLARNFLGIELNPSYIEMAMKRLAPYLQQTKLV